METTALETAQAILTDPLWSAIAVKSEAIGCHIEARYAGKYHLAWDATAEGAARLLAEIGPREHVQPLAPTGEAGQDSAYESDGETSEASANETSAIGGVEQTDAAGTNVPDFAEGIEASDKFVLESADVDHLDAGPALDASGTGSGHAEPFDLRDTDAGGSGEGLGTGEGPLDADFTEETDLTDLPALAEPEEEAPDLGAELLDEGQGELPVIEVNAEPPPATEPHQDRFYGLDDLDRRKTVAIGLVIRHAKSLMPWWTTDHDAALKELRNFAMGVSEGRWPDDAIRQLELQALETTVRRIAEIERARDNKVAFIEEADREAFATFVVEQDWP